MSAGPAVSVVVSCYNLGEYLDEAVQSVMAQTFQDFEIVIVDDGSTDEATQTLLAAYDRPRTKTFRTENRGLPAARNFGVRHTAGRYLCMLDADDRLEPTYMAQSVAALDGSPSTAFVSHWLRTFGEAEGEWRPEACDLESLLERNTVNGAALVRRTAFEAVGGFDESLREGLEDWDLWLRLVERGHAGIILPTVLHHYRRRAGSMSHTFGHPGDERYAQAYRALVARHAPAFRPRLARLVTVNEAAIADLRLHTHDLEIEYEEWLEPERRRLEDDVARLEVDAARREQTARAVAQGEQHAHEARRIDDARLAALAEVATLRQSWSWRITAPLRRVGGWRLALRRAVRR